MPQLSLKMQKKYLELSQSLSETKNTIAKMLRKRASQNTSCAFCKAVKQLFSPPSLTPQDVSFMETIQLHIEILTSGKDVSELTLINFQDDIDDKLTIILRHLREEGYQEDYRYYKQFLHLPYEAKYDSYNDIICQTTPSPESSSLKSADNNISINKQLSIYSEAYN